MHGAPKPVATGKKGNVGGIMTAGRHGSHAAAMKAGVKNLVMPGPATKKKASVSNMPRPEGEVSIDAGNLKPASMVKTMAGAPKDISMGSGRRGIHVGVRVEPAVKADEAGVIKPHTSINDKNTAKVKI